MTAGVRAARGLSGTLAGGLVVLALVVCAAQWLAGTSGRPGPGMAEVVGHVVAALNNSGYSGRVKIKEMIAERLTELLESAGRISQALAHHPALARSVSGTS